MTKAERHERIKIKKYFEQLQLFHINSSVLADTVLKYKKMEELGLTMSWFEDNATSNFYKRFKRYKVNALFFSLYFELKPHYEKYILNKELTKNLPINSIVKKLNKI